MSWLPAVLVLGGLIFLHELGHFLAARACGVEVEEFSLGIGPQIAGIRRGPTLYALRLLPVLGYVRMAGMFPLAPAAPELGTGEEDESPEATATRRHAAEVAVRGAAFSCKPLGQRVLIIAAGPLANFLVALVLYALVFGAVGLPVSPTMRIQSVEAGMPAAAAGIRPGDTISAVDDVAVHTWDELHNAIASGFGAHPDQPLKLQVDRGSASATVYVAPVRAPQGPVIGIVPAMRTTRLAPGKAVTVGVQQTAVTVYQSLAALVSLIADAVTHRSSQAQLMGPIGIGAQIDLANQAGPAVLMLLAALLSANLGMLNLLPVPALDGGRLAFLGVEWLRGGRPVDPAKEGLIHFIGLAVLMAFILIVSMHDIAHIG